MPMVCSHECDTQCSSPDQHGQICADCGNYGASVWLDLRAYGGTKRAYCEKCADWE